MTNNDLLSNQYLQDILAQPVALEDTLAALPSADILAPFAERLASGELRRIVLTGMGSSHHIHNPLMLTLIERGLSAQMMETSELIHYAPALIEPRTLIIAVSQSGRSAEIIRLLEMAQGRAPLIGVTNSADSPLAAGSDVTILTHAGEEFSVSCKTYVTALAALAWLADALTGASTQATLAALASVPHAVEQYLCQWMTHVETLRERLDGVQTITFVGRGPSLAAVGTAALTTKESAHFPSEGLSSAAFRHGPLEMAGPNHFVLVYTGVGLTAALNARLADDIRAAGGKVGLVRESASPDVFSLPPSSEVALPIFEILPAQMVTLALARLQGREPGLFEHAHKVTLVE
jgi:glucosamine--fructose-6-phosphate aminotransferase (isomerizing)